MVVVVFTPISLAGAITLKVPPDLKACAVDLCGSSITIDNTLNQQNLKTGEKNGQVHLTGNVFQIINWFVFYLSVGIAL